MGCVCERNEIEISVSVALGCCNMEPVRRY